MPGDLEKRIVDLELRFMRQEKLLDDLNDVIVEQRREIDRLTTEVRSLRDQLLAGVEPVVSEKPPHY